MIANTLRNTIARSGGSRRGFASCSMIRSEGAPSGSGQNSFNKRERAEEERYVRDSEMEKLKQLQKSIEASKKHLEQLEKDHKELEHSVKSK